MEDSERATFLESPLWQTLGAVKNGHVIDVNDGTWIAGLCIQAANLVLDDLQAILAPDTVTPEPTAEATPASSKFEKIKMANIPLDLPIPLPCLRQAS